MNLNYDEMLEYVRKELYENDLERQQMAKHSFRSRYKHITRVLGWAKRIEADLPVNREVLYTSAIFHDVGYRNGQGEHALASEKIFREYAKENNFDSDFTETVAFIIRNHSDKSLLNNPNSSNELIILLEADLLDEEGALGLTWDLMARGAKHSISYDEAFDEINKHSGHIMNQEYMVTPIAKKYWREKQEFVKTFIKELKSDLFED